MEDKLELIRALQHHKLHHIEQQVTLLWGKPGYDAYVQQLLLDVERQRRDGFGTEFRNGFPHEVADLLLLSIKRSSYHQFIREHPDGVFTFKK